MDIPYMPEMPTGELRERLARVRYVFTDLDGTMMGPNSTVLANASGEPSLDFVQTLIDLKQAGVAVVPTSGRNRAMMREDTRLLGLNAFISEMGGIVMTDLSHDTWEYFTAEMEYSRRMRSSSRRGFARRSSRAIRACSNTTTICLPATSTAR